MTNDQGGFHYASKFLDQLIKWNEVFLLKEKNSAVDTVQLYNQAVVISSGLRLERLRADKEGENTGAAFRKYCSDIGTKFLNKHRLRFLIESIKKFGE